MLEKFIAVLASYVGYLEKRSNANLESKTANSGYNNYTIFGKKYDEHMGTSFNGQAWCAMFVSECLVEAVGLAKAKELLCGNLYAYCPYGMSAFKNKGQLYTTPKKGDIVFFVRNGLAYHTGVVTSVSGNTFTTIEGNTSGGSAVIANGGGVCRKSYTVTNNMRFGRPKYGVETTEAKYNSTAWVKALQKAINVTVDGVAGEKTLAACPLLKKGSKGTVVELMQQRLGEEFKITVSGGYDGDFGSGTLAAVKIFQKQKGLEADGEVGQNTWKALLKIGETTSKEVKVDAAAKFDQNLAGTYKVTASELNLRSGAGTGKDIVKAMPNGTEFICYGYYTTVDGTKWLLGKAGKDTGFASSKYLKK